MKLLKTASGNKLGENDYYIVVLILKDLKDSQLSIQMLKNYTFLGGWQTTNLSAILIIAYV